MVHIQLWHQMTKKYPNIFIDAVAEEVGHLKRLHIDDVKHSQIMTGRHSQYM